MKINFLDNIGTKETVYFNPTINIYSDGSIIINESSAYIKGKEYSMPMFVGEPSEYIFADFRNHRYNNTELGNASNAIKIIWKNGETINFVRYKEKINETFFRSILRKLNEIS